jgi:hypothetical protein
MIGCSKMCRANPIITTRIKLQGNRAQEATSNMIMKLVIMNVIENITPIDGDSELSV